jgi:hypothetical protein
VPLSAPSSSTLPRWHCRQDALWPIHRGQPMGNCLRKQKAIKLTTTVPLI